MGTATLERPTATVTQLGFTWSCTSECGTKGHDRAEYTAHMRGHGKRVMGGTRLIRLRKGAPAATLPKLPLDDPCVMIEWDDMRRETGVCECGHSPDVHGPDWITDTEGTWDYHGKGRRRRQRYTPPTGHSTDPGCTECVCTVADYEIPPVITEARRSGQFWAAGPSPGTVWVLPYEAAPWEDGDPRPVGLRVSDDGYSMCRTDPGCAVRQAEHVRQRGVFAIITDHFGGPRRMPAKTVHTDPGCAAADGWRESDHRPHDMWRVVDTLAGQGKAEDGVTLCPRCVLLEPSEDAAEAIESSTERDSADPVTETAQPPEPSIPPDMPVTQAKHAAAGTDTGDGMDTTEHAAPPTAADRAASRMDAARERAGIRVEAARQRAREQATAGAEVATREADTITPTSVSSPGRRQRPDAAELLRQVLEQIGLYVCQYVQFPSAAAVVAAVLWIAHAAARDAEGRLIWRASPRLLLTSAENGSGKSTLMDLIALLLLSRAGRLVKVTAAALAGILGQLNEVALPDDAQLTFGSTGAASKDIQGVLLGGYTRKGTWATGKQRLTLTNVFGPAAIAGKDQLITLQRDNLKDLLARSVIIRMERPKKYMPQLDERADARGEELGKALAAVMGALQDQMQQAVRDLDAEAAGQEITEGDGGRTAQIFRQLRAVARVAGGMWPQAMDDAAEELIAAAGDLFSVEDMLADLEDVQQAGAGAGPSFWQQIEEMGK